MEPIRSAFEGYELKKDPRNIEFEYQALGLELQDHFGKQYAKRIWPLFYNARYSVPKIRDAWERYQRSGVGTFNYFMGILNKM